MSETLTRIPVALADHGYDVLIGAGLLNEAGRQLAAHAGRGRLLCVTDRNAAGHWLEPLRQTLSTHDVTLETLTLEPGEQTKSWEQLQKVCEWLLQQEVDRSTCIIALGGGVIGDLTGFAAAIVKRGCDFIQIPTTLLAQVDSSVGGKTAINSPSGKNLVGAFHQPKLVLIDPDVLQTLPARELRAGFAEVVKYGLIDDADFFGWCEANRESFFAGDIEIRSTAIARSVAAKARIVAADEKERTGTRALLNLGHTFGHALETETGYSDRLLHGEAVAAGMVLAAKFSVRAGLCPPDDAERAQALLAAAGLPVTLADCGIDVPGERLAAHMLHDKKREGDTLPFLLMRGIGQTYLDRNVRLDDVAQFLEDQRGR